MSRPQPRSGSMLVIALLAAFATVLAGLSVPAFAAEATTTMVVGPTSATVGVPVDLVASVSAGVDGTVRFYVDEELVGQPEVVGGIATVEDYTFADDGGDGQVELYVLFDPTDSSSYAQSSDSELVVVSPAPDPVETTTTVTGPTTATVGESVNLTAEVTPTTAAGLVQFFVDGLPVEEPSPIGGGLAAVSHTFMQEDSFSVTAEFTPFDDEDFMASSDDEGQLVVVSAAGSEAVETTTTVTGPSSATVGVPVDLTATVTPSDATGTVRFYINDEPVVGEPVRVEGGVARLSRTFQTEGSVWVGAAFIPDNPEEYDGSSDADGLAFTVSPPYVPSPTITGTTITGPGAAKVGESANFTATVSPATDGTVQLYVGDQPVGAPAPVVSGTATLSHTFTTAASVQVSAVFTPTSSAFTGSRAPDLTVQVTRTESSVQVTGPGAANAGAAVELTAAVSPAEAAGSVQFSVDGSLVGSPVAVASGAASLPYTFATVGAHTVTAAFTPADPATYAGSVDSAGLAVSVGAVATTVEVSGPDDAKVGDESRITATVLPAEAAGTVTFYVDDTQVATVPVDAGAASAAYTPETAGSSSIVAAFEPADADAYRSSTSAAHAVAVEAGTTAESESDAVSMEEVTVSTNSCGGRPDGRGVPGQVGPIGDFFTSIIFGVSGFLYSGLSFISSSIQNIANMIAMTFRVGPFACGRGEARPAGKVVTGTMQCVLTETGYACPAIDLPANSKLTVTASVPMPAAVAGRRVTLQAGLSSVDPLTGELTSLATSTTHPRVPKRTVLSALLAPEKGSIDSVKRGKVVTYRVRVGNEGVFRADDVRTCVRVGHGAEVRAAKGATVRGQRVCWRLPTLKKGKSVVRTLTVVAPRTKRDLTLRAIVTPKKKQADVVRLTAALPVR